MANGTLKVSNIQTSSGSGTITIGQSGETISVPSGATLDMSSGTMTLNSSMKMTPAFSVMRSSDQTISDGSWTKIQFNSEFLDSDNAFDSSTNYRFTVPSGEGGKYMLFVNAYVQYGANGSTLRTAIYKNGSSEHLSIFTDGVGVAHNSITSMVMNLSASDYIEFYAWQNRGGNDNLQGPHTVAYGYKIIGA